MKKYLVISAMVAISIFAIFSCRKSDDPHTISKQTMSSPSETELSIQAFINGMKSNLKDETTYTISEAIWYAEATLNYTYAIYDSSFVFLSRESSNFSLDINQSNTINHSELVAAYQDMVDSLEEHYDGIQTTPKHVMLCDITNSGVSGGVLHLSMKSVIACDYTASQYGSFGPTDYWWSGGMAGKCNNYEGEGDATTALEYKLLHPLIASDPEKRIFYEDLDTITAPDPDEYPYENAPRGTRGYWYGSENPEDGIQCISPSELNFYISSNGIPYIIDDVDCFEDKDFCDIDIRWDFLPSTEVYYEQHFYDIVYGVRQETTIPASEL